MTTRLADWGTLAIRSSCPGYHEVLLLDLVEGDAPLQARVKVEELATLLSESKITAFCTAMEQLCRHRMEYFSTKPFYKMPLVRLSIHSPTELAAAERFVESAATGGSSSPHHLDAPGSVTIDLSLHIRFPPTKKTKDQDACDHAVYLLRLVALVEKIKQLAPRYRLVIMELDFQSVQFVDDHVMRAASQLCEHAQATTTQIRASLCIPKARADTSSPDTRAGCSLTAWGEFFQSVCRVSAVQLDLDEDQDSVAPNLRRNDNERCSSLCVYIPKGVDTRLVAMFWSAVACSRGYNFLEVNESADDGENYRNREHDQLRSKYATLALVSTLSSISRFRWLQRVLQAHDIQAMEQVQEASLQSRDALAQVLWHREWSMARDGRVFEIKTLNEDIVKTYGWLLHDSGKGEWVDVFVPGFAQCSVKRDQWIGLKMDEIDNSRQHTARPGLKRLWLSQKDTHYTTWRHIGRLFPILGASLTKIQIDKSGYFDTTRLTAQGLLAILESCPQLRHLQVEGFRPPRKPVVVDTSRIVATSLQYMDIILESEADYDYPDGRVIPNRSSAFDTFFADIFPAIGSNLEHLGLRKMDATIPFALGFQALMQSSPKLQYMGLRGLVLDSLDPVVDAYRRGQCRLTTVFLTTCRMSSSSVARFAACLGDQTCLAAKNLDSLTISMGRLGSTDEHGRYALDESSLTAFLHMLPRNTTLSILSLTADLAYVDPDHGQLKRFGPLFAELSGLHLPFQQKSSRTTLCARRAFVSALEKKRLPWTVETVRRVFAFSTDRQIRDCHFYG